MLSKSLEGLLFDLCQQCDMAGTAPEDILERFDSLRAHRKLPYGRKRRGQALTNGGSLLGLVTRDTKWAGHTAAVLCDLRSVTGADTSFFGAATLQGAIEQILSDSNARNSVLRLAVSGAESATNSSGFATLVYQVDGDRRRVSYVPTEQVSQLQRGVDSGFDEEFRQAPLSREVSFSRRFFDRIASAMEMAKASPESPEGDGSEYETEEARQERFRSSAPSLVRVF